MNNPSLQLGSYRTSKDYQRLARLAKHCSIICIVDYKAGPDGDMVIRDVAQTLCHSETIQISARGICYVYSFGAHDFVKQCERLNVEFIVPASTVQEGAA